MGTQNTDKKLDQLNKESAELKKTLDDAQEALTTTNSTLADKEDLLKANQAKIENAAAVKDIAFPSGTDGMMKTAIDVVRELKKAAEAMHTEAKEALHKVGEALMSSSKLEAEIEKLTKDKKPVSKDLATDSPNANATITQAWKDTVKAFNDSLAVVEAILGLERSLVTIDKELVKIDNASHLGRIQEKFNKISANLNQDISSLNETKAKQAPAYNKARKAHEAKQDQIKKETENQAVLAAING